jgi:hypothetical protein
MVRKTTHDSVAKKKRVGRPPVIFKEGMAGLQGGAGGRLRRHTKFTRKGGRGGIVQPKQLGKQPGPGVLPAETGIGGGVLILGGKGGKKLRCQVCGKRPKGKGKGRGPRVRYLPIY